MPDLKTAILKTKTGTYDLYVGEYKLHTCTSRVQSEVAAVACEKLYQMLKAANFVYGVPDFGVAPPSSGRGYFHPDQGIRQVGRRWYVTSPIHLRGGFETQEDARKARLNLLQEYAARPKTGPQRPRKKKSRPTPTPDL